jgi:hypothetical protein
MSRAKTIAQFISESGDNMKTRMTVLTIALCLVAGAVSLASDAATANMGTWKLNEAQSKFAPGATKNTTVVYEATGDMVKVTVDGMTSDGKPAHNEWTGKFDGKFYPVIGDPNTDVRAYKLVGNLTLHLTTKKSGKVVATGSIVVSANGKTRTVSTTSADSKGMPTRNVAVYDKQ